MSNTPIYDQLAIKYGWLTTKNRRWYRLLAVVR